MSRACRTCSLRLVFRLREVVHSFLLNRGELHSSADAQVGWLRAAVNISASHHGHLVFNGPKRSR